jgi:hypothetical protein
MTRKLSAKCICIEAFTHVISASVLGIRSVANSAYPDSRIETPEKRIDYTVGQVCDLGSKRNRADFMKFHAGKFRELAE